MKAYTDREMMSAILDYADRNGVDKDHVVLSRLYDVDGYVIGFRLSLDFDGRSKGCDEVFGEWR